MGASELDQDRDSDSYEDDMHNESIEENIQEEIKDDPAQISESGMFSRAEESLALTSLKFNKSPTDMPQATSPTVAGA